MEFIGVALQIAVPKMFPGNVYFINACIGRCSWDGKSYFLQELKQTLHTDVEITIMMLSGPASCTAEKKE